MVTLIQNGLSPWTLCWMTTACSPCHLVRESSSALTSTSCSRLTIWAVPPPLPSHVWEWSSSGEWTFNSLWPSYAKWQLQSSAVITWFEIVRYCINSCRNWSWISIRCWIHKRHPIPCPNGRAMGRFCEYLWENWPRYNGTALYPSTLSSLSGNWQVIWRLTTCRLNLSCSDWALG